MSTYCESVSQKFVNLHKLTDERIRFIWLPSHCIGGNE